jgi:TP901 family phage tail tape measure protein
MASKYAIETVFRLIDQVTMPLNKIGVKSNKVGRAIKNDFEKASRQIDRLGKGMGRVVTQTAKWGAVAAGAGLAMATKQFVEFDDALKKSSAIFSDLDPLADNFSARVAEIGKAARDVAKITEFSATETMNALTKMAQAGMETNQAMALLSKTADLATAAGIDLDNAVGMAAGTLNVFNMMSKDTGVLEKNFGRISDIMTRTANLADQNISAVFESFSIGGSFFNRGNQQIEDLGAIVDGLASKNMKAAEAGTAIRNMMLSFSVIKTDSAKNAVAALGLDLVDERGNLRNIIDLVDQLNAGVKGMGGVQKDTYLEALFGKRGIVSVQKLMDVGGDALRKFRTDIQNSAGAAALAAEIMRSSIKNKLKVLGSALTEFGFKFVEAFEKQGVDIIGKLTEAVNNFDPTPIINFARTAFSAIAKVAGVVGFLAKVAWNLRYVIITIAAPMAVWKGILLAAALATKVATFWQNMFSGAAKICTFIISGQAKATALLYAGMIKSIVATKAHVAATAVSSGVQRAFTAALQFQAAWLKVFKLDIVGAKIATLAHAGATKISEIATRLFAATTQFLSKIFKFLKLDILFARISVIAHTAAINAAGAAQKVLAFITGGLSKLFKFLKLDIIASTIAIKAQAVASKAAAVAQGILNAVMSANPIALVIIAVVALIAVIVLLVKNWDKVQNKVMAVITIFTGPFGLVISVVKELIQNWGLVAAAFKDGGILSAIKTIGGVLLSGLLAPIQGLLELIALIPGIGGLADTGAKKIQEIRNALKGIENTKITAAVNAVIPESVQAQMMAGYKMDMPDLPTDNIEKMMEQFETPGLEMPDYMIPDFTGGTVTGGLSKLRGVVDVSGGPAGAAEAIGRAVDSAVPADPTRTVTQFVDSATPDLLTRNVIDIADILRHIDTTLGGDPRGIAPVTQAEQTAYSLQERRETVGIEVSAAKGTEARITRAPRDINIELVSSGSNA